MSEIKRKLATIEKIAALNPIKDADAIEVAAIRGWKVVVKKGEFQVGDLCVYCEIDSVLPERPEFEFLANKNYRIKTIKLRGQVSQGIAFPLSILDSINMNEKYDCWDNDIRLGLLERGIHPIVAQSH